MKTPAPITLQDARIRLEPLSPAHVPGLIAHGLDEALWRWIPTPVTDAAAMRDYVDLALAEQARGTALPFAIVDVQRGGHVVGSTRYGAIEVAHRRLEIGWTWLALAAQRTAVNTSAKRLLLAHAFETLGANRVELKTDALNLQSRAAILRLGATQEGILRQHVRCASGRMRDTVYFSILADDWPAVRARLDARLGDTAADASDPPRAVMPTP